MPADFPRSLPLRTAATAAMLGKVHSGGGGGGGGGGSSSYPHPLHGQASRQRHATLLVSVSGSGETGGGGAPPNTVRANIARTSSAAPTVDGALASLKPSSSLGTARTAKDDFVAAGGGGASRSSSMTTTARIASSGGNSSYLSHPFTPPLNYQGSAIASSTTGGGVGAPSLFPPTTVAAGKGVGRRGDNDAAITAVAGGGIRGRPPSSNTPPPNASGFSGDNNLPPPFVSPGNASITSSVSSFRGGGEKGEVGGGRGGLSISNPHSHSHPKDALGNLPGWGVGLTHSGSYTSTRVRMNAPPPVPLLAEDASSQDAVRSALRERRLLASASRIDAESLARTEARERAAKEAERVARAAKAEGERAARRLEALRKERVEIDAGRKKEWKDRVSKFKQRAIREEGEELKRTREKHEKILAAMIEEGNTEEERHRQMLAEISPSVGVKRRKDESAVDAVTGKSYDLEGERSETSTKRTRIGDASTPSKDAAGGGGESSKGLSGKKEDSEEIFFPKDNGDHAEEKDDDDVKEGEEEEDIEEEEGVILESVKKKDELEKITSEVNNLNKTKSQMIWLLKEVITAEKKRNDEVIRNTKYIGEDGKEKSSSLSSLAQHKK